MAKSAYSQGNNYNSTLNTDNPTFTGTWEDVKDYDGVMISGNSSSSDITLTLQWAATTGRNLPADDSDVLCTDVVILPNGVDWHTFEHKHRARWFRLKATVIDQGETVAVSISTMYKGHTNQPSIVDSDGTAVDINVGSNSNSLLTLFTDLSGVPLKTEHSNTGSALYTSIKDHPVTLGNDDGKALIVAIRDGDHDISAVSGSVLVHPSNNIGYSQAGTTGVAADSPGVAMYLSLTDDTIQVSSTKNSDTINAMYVAMTLSGVLVGPNNPLPAVMNTISAPAANHFDISTGIEADQFYTYSDLSSTGLNLFNLNTYNDGAVPVWTKVYDMSAGYITDVSANNSRYYSRVRLNVATPPGTYRDLKFPRGLTFNNGMWFRSTTEPTYDSSLGPGESALFVNGCYYRPSGARNITIGSKIADIPSFPLGGLTGLEDLKTIDFRSDHVAGSVTFSYNQQEQLLSLSTIIERGTVTSLEFAFDDETYDIDLSDYKLNHPLVTDNISITPEQLETSRLNIVLDNGTTLSAGWHVN